VYRTSSSLKHHDKEIDERSDDESSRKDEPVSANYDSQPIVLAIVLLSSDRMSDL